MLICAPAHTTCARFETTPMYTSTRVCAQVNSNELLTPKIADEECFISEDDSESHCLKKIAYEFPELLYPGYQCMLGATSTGLCAFGPK